MGAKPDSITEVVTSLNRLRVSHGETTHLAESLERRVDVLERHQQRRRLPSGDDVFGYVLGLVLLAGLAVAATIVVKAIWSSHESTYCYIQQGQGFALSSERPWMPDDVMGTFTTLDEAVAAAARVGCVLK